MKAEELMIGDLVTTPSGDISRVTQIVKDGYGIHVAVLNDKYNYYMEGLQGIPLTAEILEANFEKKGANFGIFDDYFDFELHEYNDGTWLVTYHCCEMSLPDEQVLIFHVHQLQHFMHHCGIEKEIVVR